MRPLKVFQSFALFFLVALCSAGCSVAFSGGMSLPSPGGALAQAVNPPATTPQPTSPVSPAPQPSNPTPPPTSPTNVSNGISCLLSGPSASSLSSNDASLNVILSITDSSFVAGASAYEVSWTFANGNSATNVPLYDLCGGFSLVPGGGNSVTSLFQNGQTYAHVVGSSGSATCYYNVASPATSSALALYPQGVPTSTDELGISVAIPLGDVVAFTAVPSQSSSTVKAKSNVSSFTVSPDASQNDVFYVSTYPNYGPGNIGSLTFTATDSSSVTANPVGQTSVCVRSGTNNYSTLLIYPM